MGRVAGHDFVNGVCERLHVNGARCGRKWVDIRPYAEDIGVVNQPGIAHYGNLTPSEWDEMRQKALHDEYIYSVATLEAAGLSPAPRDSEVVNDGP